MEKKGKSKTDRVSLLAFWAPASAIVALAAAMRLSGLDAFSVTLDEATMGEMAKGVMARGYPSLYVGTMEVPLATYELVPFFLALSISLLGFSDFSIRLPSALFGIFTTILVLALGKKWFNRRTGLLAGLLYGLSPWAIHWSQNCFHPSQTQFFVLLTLIPVHRLLSEEQIPARTHYLAAGSFSCAYLSWEGSGFVLPILLCVALMMRWGKWDWLKNRHLWIASGLLLLVMFAQGLRRVLLNVGYLMVGSGKSDLSLPQLVFTETSYSPYYYLKNFLGTESHLLLTLVFIAGSCFVRRDNNLRFLYALTILAIAFMTNFLAYYNAHYIYYLLPVFLLAVAAATVRILDALPGPTAPGLLSLRAAHAVAGFMLLGLVFAYATPYGLRLSELSEDFRNPVRRDLRREIAGIDYRQLATILMNHYEPGDVVISAAPLAMRHYAGIDGDYFLQTITGRKVIFDPNVRHLYYRDKYAGNPVLRSQQELDEVLSRYQRVWLYAAPYGGFKDIVHKEILDFIQNNMEVISETFDGRLYLWKP